MQSTRITLPAFVLVSSLSSVAGAEEYQLFTHAVMQNRQSDYDDLTFWQTSATYYFDKKATLGPLDKFSFINTTSYIALGLRGNTEGNIDHGLANIGGEWISGHIGFGGEVNIENTEYDSGYMSGQVNASWFFTDRLVAKINYNDVDDRESYMGAEIAYDYALNATDHFGSRLIYTDNPNEGDDLWEWQGEYYTDLGGHYLNIAASYQSDGDSDIWSFEPRYYFNQRTSLAFYYAKSDSDFDNGFQQSSTTSDTYGAQFKHFFTPHIAIAAGYLNTTQSSDYSYLPNDYEYQSDFDTQNFYLIATMQF